MAKKMIICPNCGGEFDASLTCCPYCGTQNDEAAEREYLGKVRKINRNLRNLSKRSDAQMAGSAAKGVRRAVLILALIAGAALLIYGIMSALSRSEANRRKSNYAAIQENFDTLDEYYEAGDYDAMLEYFNNIPDDMTPYTWKHAPLCYSLNAMQEVDGYWEQEKEETLDSYELTEILYDELEIEGIQYDPDAEDEDVAYVEEHNEPYIDDLYTRFLTTQELREQFTDQLKEYDGFPSYTQCEKLIKEMQ